MADFVPHPLVTCVARELGETNVPALKDDAKVKAAYTKVTGDRQARRNGRRTTPRTSPRRTISPRRSPIRRTSPA